LIGQTYFTVGDRFGGPIELFGAGDTVLAGGLSSVIMWAVPFMILRGLKHATFINTILAVAKIIPILLFLVRIPRALVFGFTPSRFAESFWGGGGETASVWSQVAATMAVTLFVFLGVEGASVYSRYAKERKDVGTAAVFGFIGVTCLMVLVTMLPYAAMKRP